MLFITLPSIQQNLSNCSAPSPSSSRAFASQRTCLSTQTFRSLPQTFRSVCEHRKLAMRENICNLRCSHPKVKGSPLSSIFASEDGRCQNLCPQNICSLKMKSKRPLKSNHNARRGGARQGEANGGWAERCALGPTSRFRLPE